MITSPLEDELTYMGGIEVVLGSPTTPKQPTFRAVAADVEPTTPLTSSFSPRWPSSPESSPEPATPESSLPTSLLSTPATSFSSSTTGSPEYRSKAPASALSLSPGTTNTFGPFASILSHEPANTTSTSSLSPVLTTTLGLFASIIGHELTDTTAPVTIPASCLQCTLLDLPCSQTHPACTRCARNHEQDFNGWYGIRDIIEPCLAQRRRTMQEVREGRQMGQTEMLCRLEDDGDGTWEQKLELASELLWKKMEVEERKNWVLPVPDGRAALRREELRGLWYSVNGDRWG